MYRLHSLSEKLAVIGLYESGYCSTAIGEQLHLCARDVRRRLSRYRAHGIGALSNNLTSAAFKASVVSEVFEKSLSCAQVALKSGVSESAVYSWV